MERHLTLGCLGLGFLGWLCAFLLAPSRARLESARVAIIGRNALVLALGLPILVWLFTLPTSPPFSAGQGFGRGFLLGGAASLAGAAAVFRAASGDSRALSIAATAPLFAALFAVCAPLLWLRSAVIDALLGVALGWLGVVLILRFGSSDEAEAPRELLFNGCAFAVALCAGAALGVYRDFVVADVARGTYSAVVVTLAVSVALALLGGALLGQNDAETDSFSESRPVSALPNAFRFLLVAGVPLGLSALLATKFLDDANLVYLVSAGVVMGWALRWMIGHAAKSEDSASVLPLAILVALSGFMFAFQLMQGFGVALLLLAAWPFSLLVGNRATNRDEAAQTLTLILSFLSVVLMSRLFATHYRAELRGAGLSDQFALFGFVAGAALPVFLSSFLKSEQKTGLARSLGVGALGLGLLAAMLAVWGLKVVPAWFLGLSLASAGWSFGALKSQSKPLIALICLSMGAAVTQWAGRFASLAELPRAERLHLLLWSLGGLIILVLVVDYGSRAVSKLRARRAASPAPS